MRIFCFSPSIQILTSHLYLASASRAFCPPDRLTPFSRMRDKSPPIIFDKSTSSAHACNTSLYLHHATRTIISSIQKERQKECSRLFLGIYYVHLSASNASPSKILSRKVPDNIQGTYIMPKSQYYTPTTATMQQNNNKVNK